MMDDIDDLGTIDKSIQALDNYIEYNRKATLRLIVYLMSFTTLIVILPYTALLLSRLNPGPTGSESLTAQAVLNSPTLYIFAGLFIVVFGVLMAIYRFHLNEIARAEHYRIGFHRIRVAANNATTEGFQSEVREALTERAFEYQPAGIFAGRRGKKMNSPLPGHPTSDLSTLVLNKLLEGIEVRKKQ